VSDEKLGVFSDAFQCRRCGGEITDTEGDGEDEDGVKYDFHWHVDEF